MFRKCIRYKEIYIQHKTIDKLPYSTIFKDKLCLIIFLLEQKNILFGLQNSFKTLNNMSTLWYLLFMSDLQSGTLKPSIHEVVCPIFSGTLKPSIHEVVCPIYNGTLKPSIHEVVCLIYSGTLKPSIHEVVFPIYSGTLKPSIHEVVCPIYSGTPKSFL